MARNQVTPTSGLSTSENSETATFTVALATVPEFAVDVTITSLDGTEGLVRIPAGTSASNLTLSFAADISDLTPQTVVVAGQSYDMGTEPAGTVYTVQVGSVSSSDTGYAAIDPDNVVARNLDFP
ncbi:MAG: hypothetical protein VCB79_03235 [Dehalococcoidia bacterium]